MEQIVSGGEGHIRDLHVSDDRTRLAYLRWRNRSFEVRVRHISTETEQTLAVLPGSVTSTFAKGWWRDSGLVIVRSTRIDDEVGATDVEVLLVSDAGEVRTLGRVDRAFISTARLDADRSVLFVTKSEGGVHNVLQLSLTNGQKTLLTNNSVQGVSYSGVAVAHGLGLVVARDIWARDLWIARIGTRAQ